MVTEDVKWWNGGASHLGDECGGLEELAVDVIEGEPLQLHVGGLGHRLARLHLRNRCIWGCRSTCRCIKNPSISVKCAINYSGGSTR